MLNVKPGEGVEPEQGSREVLEAANYFTHLYS